MYFPLGSPVTSGSCIDITTGRLLCKSEFQQTIFFYFSLSLALLIFFGGKPFSALSPAKFYHFPPRLLLLDPPSSSLFPPSLFYLWALAVYTRLACYVLTRPMQFTFRGFLTLYSRALPPTGNYLRR